MAEYNTGACDEMDWQSIQAPANMIQVISQLHRELRADLKQDIASSINMNAQQHRCQQVTSDSIRETVQTAMDEWFTDNQKNLKPLKEGTEPASPETLKPELVSEPDDFCHRAQVEELTRKLELADSELADLNSQLKATQSRADQLRSMIIPNDGKPILDSEIERLFSEVRATTQIVACRLYSKRGTYQNPKTGDSKAFFKEIEDLSPDCQRDAIHTYLFLFIRQQFFPRNIRGCNIGNHYPNLEKALAATEWQLTEAVKNSHPGGMAFPLVAQNCLGLTTISSGAHQKELNDWTRATFKCIDLLKGESDEPDSYAAYLEEFFKPAETDDTNTQGIGRRKLKKLCEKAHELGILMRRATDTFQVFIVKDDLPFTDCEDVAEELRCNGGRDSSRTKVVDFCLFGGLRKISSDYPTKPILLEKAMVSTRFVGSTG
ncbi:hypothetical protein Forpi1262_v000179 [Fusarium oxysporum f. sp. raphani]|uniref:Uncharacterized protein n=1 Tax=Fusarium oxysporum f. sp. raphani TaxID=96318 RepID=A0A8J5UD72_FUSOX|nr:hypothetical protein Forpi1262_v000179 [Fusarium oxysporum f. sp. raphani]